MPITFELLLILVAVAAVAGWVDAVAGGGGLLTLPALLLAGLPPATALATNKLQGSAGTLMASWVFVRRGEVQLLSLRWHILATFIGAVLGTWVVLRVDSEALLRYLPFLLMAVGVYFWLSPHLDGSSKPAKLRPVLFALTLCPLLGFYDGFIGPGTGSFMLLAFVTLSGLSLTTATAHTKVLNCTSNLASLLYFGLYGEIYWLIGCAMIVGQAMGATLGARQVLDKGSALIKPLLVVMCFLMSANLIRQHLLS